MESVRVAEEDPGVDRAVDRGTVHRHAAEEVFLTSVRAVGADAYRFGTRLPSGHGYYGDQIDAAAGCDPLLLLEACRQASYVVFHEFRSTPLDRAFLLRAAAVEVLDPAVLRTAAAEGGTVLHAEVVRQLRNRRRSVSGMRNRYAIVVGDRTAARATIEAHWVDPDRMRDLRVEARRRLGLQAPPGPPATARGVEPARVGRRRPGNVVVADDGDPEGLRLVVDPGHPTFFDHPLDHVPGMLIVEACRQAVLAATPVPAPADAGRTAVVAVRFHEFAELDLPVRLRAEPAAAGWTVVASQCGRRVAEAAVRTGTRAHRGAEELLTAR